MSSTDDGPAILGAYFDDVLAPLAARLHERGEQPFPLAPDPDCPSYFVARPRPSMAHEDFGAASCADAVDFQARLGTHWLGLGRNELLADLDRVGPLAQAAKDVHGPGDGSAELPPHLYVMF